MLLQDLRDDARFLISPQLTAAQYSDAILDKNLNNWYRTVLGWVVPEQGEWEIQGDYLVIDLIKDVSEYEIPVGLIRIYKAEIMYANGGKYTPLEQYDPQRNQQVAIGNDTIVGSSTATPTLQVFGDFLKVDPAPTENVTNGFKIWAQLDFKDMDDTLNLPDLNPLIHRTISIGGAFDYALSKEMWQKALEFKRLLYGDTRVPNDLGFKGQVEKLYAMRTGDRRDRFTAKPRSYR